MYEERIAAMYIMTNRRNGTLYIGVTGDLIQRISTHKADPESDGFVKRYNLNKLVYYEMYEDVRDAIGREKRVKKWRRAWKVRLIESFNKTWRDLSHELH